MLPRQLEREAEALERPLEKMNPRAEFLETKSTRVYPFSILLHILHVVEGMSGTASVSRHQECSHDSSPSISSKMITKKTLHGAW